MLDPLAWASLRQLKYGAGSAQSLLGAGTTDAAPMILSLPVVVNNEMPANSGLVIDRAAVVSAVSAVSVAVDSSVFFTSDSTALRATWSVGHAVVRPNRLGNSPSPPAARTHRREGSLACPSRRGGCCRGRGVADFQSAQKLLQVSKAV